MNFTLFDQNSFQDFYVDVDTGGELCIYEGKLEEESGHKFYFDIVLFEAIYFEWQFKCWKAKNQTTDFYCKDENDQVFMSVGSTYNIFNQDVPHFSHKYFTD